MTNINCSEKCIHESNGKCILNHVSITANILGYGSDCAYYMPREKKLKPPPDENRH